MLYPRYRIWRTQGIRDVDGVLVASDSAQEWLLPWWWDHYSKYNNYPVAFVDFGMSEEKKEWCREHGEFIPLPVLDVFVAGEEEIDSSLLKEWKKIYGEKMWLNSRNAWFKKPLACLQSPFLRTLWLDLDCEVRGSLAPVFDYSDHPSGIALHKERFYHSYNGGVICFRRGIPLIETWVSECFVKNHRFPADQELLSNILDEQKIAIGELPADMNWLISYGDNSDALIYHWCGSGHIRLRHQIELNDLLKNPSVLELLSKIEINKKTKIKQDI